MTLAAPLAGSAATKDRSFLVIFNPTAGGRRRRRLDHALAALEHRGWDCEILETQARGDAEALARTASGEARASRLLIAGGDGTINEAVNGALSAGAKLPLGIIPLGTANVLAAELGMMDMGDAVDAAAAGAMHTIWPGRANERNFVLMAGAGFDAHVVATVDPALKRKIGKLAYVWTMLRLAFRFSFPRYRVRVDGVWHEAASVVVSKGHYYGGRFVLAPRARLDRPEFQVCLFTKGGRWNLVRYALALPLGLLPKMKSITLLPAREVVIEGPEGDPVQGDGDVIAHLPVTIRLAERPLTMVAPARRA
ncbi:MAG TPA: diacylglycerol kinase family protein [Hypericibacter adhaerens]|uniref:diacylglycerol/lipid kinase family protein n=1 Tax=Hypericibacter adhaerens TaxID=2602016 RepID=UPI002BF657A4|nr:diacylglycerol kinase family protein [Hypericibacter adhaerens]HWA43573.1 diacylglycerol kinase family protein [Hypericibacter adhaerens]